MKTMIEKSGTGNNGTEKYGIGKNDTAILITAEKWHPHFSENVHAFALIVKSVIVRQRENFCKKNGEKLHCGTTLFHTKS